MLYPFAKSILFRIDPERAHHVALRALASFPRIPGMLPFMRALYGASPASELEQHIWGIRFANPIGLAAGLDKEGQAIPAFSSMGFGFVEVGTVTPFAQPGNERPRLFRLLEDDALVNRMGFNNPGADALRVNVQRAERFRAIPVAVNIGKNKSTPNEQAANDYIACIRTLYEAADFFVVNISSPNTPDLRKLQHGDSLSELLGGITNELRARNEAAGRRIPVLVKIAPDLSGEELKDTVDLIVKHGIDGIIATNTTLDRNGLASKHASETGGLSGRPLAAKTTAVIRDIYRETNGRIPIVGSGGIFDGADAYEKIRAGASLIEIYTALIYAGPSVVRRIQNELLQLLKRDGFQNVSEAIGASHT